MDPLFLVCALPVCCRNFNHVVLCPVKAELGNCECHDCKKFAFSTECKLPAPLTLDLLTLSPPCQPFSDLRGDRFTSTPRKHRLFPVLFGDVGSAMSLMEIQQPLMLMMEEVGGIAKPYTRNDLTTGLQDAEERIMAVKRDAANGGTAQHFVAYAVVIVDARTWVSQARLRYCLAPPSI